MPDVDLSPLNRQFIDNKQANKQLGQGISNNVTPDIQNLRHKQDLNAAQIPATLHNNAAMPINNASKQPVNQGFKPAPSDTFENAGKDSAPKDNKKKIIIGGAIAAAVVLIGGFFLARNGKLGQRLQEFTNGLFKKSG